jgi:integrase
MRTYLRSLARNKRQELRQEVINSMRRSKTDLRYWEKRVFRPRSTRAGGVLLFESPDYSVKLQFRNRRAAFTLATPNRREAAERARERYLYLVANGWEAFLAKYRSDALEGDATPLLGSRADLPPPPAARTNTRRLTIGQYLTAAATRGEWTRETFNAYVQRFRFMVGEIFGLASASKREGGEGFAAWRTRIDSIELAELMPARVLGWKKARLANADTDREAQARALNTVTSILRQGRALFPEKLTRELGICSPFEGVAVERQSAKFYGAGIEPETLIRRAETELGLCDPEAFKAFLLAINLGLRRAEIDALEWSAFDLKGGYLNLQETRWLELKTKGSSAAFRLEPKLLAWFRAWRAKATSGFVLESERQAKAVDYRYYRAAEVWARLIAWLRAQRVQGDKPVHTLRKLYGSAIARAHGIHAASTHLRHSDIRTTADHYADSRITLSPSFSAALSESDVELQFPAPEEQGSDRRNRRSA